MDVAAPPKVSLVIPVYRAEAFLRQCLDSVRNQTLQDWEAICVDDGSPDNSGTILDDYAAQDARFRVFHQANAGQSASRNRGIELATGEYLAFLDADDWLEPETFETAYQTISQDTEGAEMVFYLYRYVDFPHAGEFDLGDLKQTVFTTDLERMATVRHSRNVAWNRLYRRTFLLEKGLRFPVGRNMEDNYFSFLSSLMATRILGISKYFYNYRYAGYSNDPKQRYKLMDLIEVYQQLVEAVSSLEVSEEVKNEMLWQKLATCSWVYRRVSTPKQRPECRQRILAAITEDEWQQLSTGKLWVPRKLRWFLGRFRWGWRGWLREVFRFPRKKNR